MPRKSDRTLRASLNLVLPKEVIMFAGKLAWSSLLIAVLLTATAVTGWARHCSEATLKGTYGVFEQGTLMVGPPNPIFPPAPFPIVTVANPTFDGAGNFSGTFTGSFGGIIVPGTFTGTYKVTSDCAYSDEYLVLPEMEVSHHTGFITGEGALQEIHYIYSDRGVVTAGTAKKLHGSANRAEEK
jgi:hypothetical protein